MVYHTYDENGMFYIPITWWIIGVLDVLCARNVVDSWCARRDKIWCILCIQNMVTNLGQQFFVL